MTSVISGISKQWTLFLDRDGVINERLVDDYVKRWEDFVFTPGALQSFREFDAAFGKIVVVTNQQGVGKGLMTEDELNLIHSQMVNAVNREGGRIDKVYYCTKLEHERPFCRKPNPGMALQAKRDFPEIHFKRSVMAGDSLSDLRFGKRLGMKTVLIAPTNTMARQHPNLTDLWFKNLLEFADFLKNLPNS
ncbi:MAG: HAD family hydrolase [Bacteroidales bacterium]|nr:HAD family hydrolase [Bacteroidales bacterium]